MDEQFRGSAEFRSSLLSLSTVHHSSLDAGATHHGAPVGVALLGKGALHRSSRLFFYFKIK